MRNYSENFANTVIKLNCCNYRCSVTKRGMWIVGTYLAMQNITVGLYVELNWDIREGLKYTENPYRVKNQKIRKNNVNN